MIRLTRDGSHGLALALALFCIPATVHAGQFVSNFNSPPVAGVTLSGSANYTGGVAQLTPATNGQTASMTLADLDAGTGVDCFDAHMRIFIGGGSGADGMSVNFGAPGSIVVEEEGVTTGLALSMDTFDSGGGDLFNRVEVRFNGTSIGSSAVLTLRTGSFVDLDVKMAPGGVLTVHHNHTLAINALTIPGWGAVAGRQFVFGARTGGLNDRHEIDNLVISTWNSTSLATSFDSPPVAGITLFGNAAYAGGAVRLTTTSPGGQQGTMIVGDLDAGAAVQSFSARFRLLIGNGTGADGFSFNFGNVPDGLIGEEGHGGLGLTVSLDTFQNNGGDVAGAIETKWNNVAIAGGTTGARTLRTNSFVDLLVTVTAAGRLAVVQNNGTNDSVALVDVAIPSWTPQGGWRFGFGARTGGSTDDHWVDDLKIETIACGNGAIESGEQCDLGAANGLSTSCCTSTCALRAAGQTCRPSAGACDLAETCTGSGDTCPTDINPACTATPTSTATSTPTETDTPTASPTETPTSTPTETDTPTASPTETPTSTPTETDTPTASPTETPTTTPTETDTPTASPTETPTSTPTETDTPTASPTDTPTETPADTPTETPTETVTPTISPTGTATPLPTSAVRAYLGYKMKAPKTDALGSPIPQNIFPKGWVITVNDRLIDDADGDDPENFVVSKTKELLNAAAVDGLPAADNPPLHYLRYNMKLGRESVAPLGANGKFPKPAKHTNRIWQLNNSFGSLNVLSKKVKGLLLPAAADPGAAQSAPENADHYICYQIKPTSDVTDQTPDKGDGTGKFRKDLQAFLDSPFFDDCALLADGATTSFDGTAAEGACLLAFKKPVELCNPIDKTEVVPPRETVAVLVPSSANELKSLLCYKVGLATKLTYTPAASFIGGTVGVKLDPKQAKHVKRGQKTGNPIYTTPANLFPGPIVVDSLKPGTACIPTDVVGVTAAP